MQPAQFQSMNQQSWGQIHFHNKLAFYTGTLAITIGVLLHIPMFYMARSMGYKLVGMPMSNTMLFGMFLIIGGIVLSIWGVIPVKLAMRRHKVNFDVESQIMSQSIISFTAHHWMLCVALIIGLIVDVMKPMTLAFVIPGSIVEYDLSAWGVAFLPLGAYIGMISGSFLWGWLGDLVGRRPCILISGIIFMATSICGAMPTFEWNVFMCGLMGFSSAGMIPVVVSLLAEVLPTSYRGALLVVIIGVGSLGGYLVASGSAALLEPHFGWRILWFLGLPTGLLLIFLNRFIPESPRFLLAHGRKKEAENILKDFGVVIAKSPAAPAKSERPVSAKRIKLFTMPYLPHTLAMMLYGLASGLVTYCFLLWLPSNLRIEGLGVGSSDAILAKSALAAFPGILIVAWAYNKLGSQKTLILFSLLTTVVLLGFILTILSNNLSQTYLSILVIALLFSSTGMITALAPYSAELYPTQIRSTGSGFVSGSTRIGGLLGIAAVLIHIKPTLLISALLVIVPVALATIVISIIAIETRMRNLEEIDIARKK